jgi:hypothetical protein
MDENRLVSLPALTDLSAAGSILKAEAIKTDRGWKLVFLNGKDRFSHSRIGLRAARGGERFYKSLDSVHDLLVKIGCKSLVVSIHQRAIGDGTPPSLQSSPKPRAPRVNPAVERLHELMEKDRRSFLTKAERDEMTDLSERYAFNR